MSQSTIHLYRLGKRKIHKIVQQTIHIGASVQLFKLNKKTDRDGTLTTKKDLITLRTLVCALHNGTNEIEYLGFAVYRGYIPFLINSHLVKAPYFFEKLLQLRKERIGSGMGYNGYSMRDAFFKDLVQVKFIYNLAYIARRRCVCIMVQALYHLVCSDVSKFTARFIGCYYKCTTRILRQPH